jgi:hypothetical protein
MEVYLMPIQTEQAITSFIFADQRGDYYVIPAGTLERGRVSAERKAAIDEALREHEVTGYVPLPVVFAAGMAAGMVVTLVGVGVGATLVAASSDCFERKTIPQW